MKLFLTTLLSILVQFGLDILGWGGFAAFFSRSPLVALFSRANRSSGERQDRRNHWVPGAFGVLALLIVGSIARLWPVFVLGPRFSGLVAIQPNHELVTTGSDRYVLNPSYLGLLVSSLGWALVFRAAAGVLIAALLPVPPLARIRPEDRPFLLILMRRWRRDGRIEIQNS